MPPARRPGQRPYGLDHEGYSAKGDAVASSKAVRQEMSSVALSVDDFFDDGLTPANGTAVPSAGAQLLEFPKPKGPRLQDIVLNLLLDGEDYESIAVTIGRKAADVEKIARSEWAKKEITKRLSEQGEESQRDTLQNLIRIQGFDAVHKLGSLMKCGNPHIELKAVQLALQYSLPLPSKLLKEEKEKGSLPQNAEALREEYERNQREIARHMNPNSHIE
ncbi:MAG TPA: hypothetical protein VM120_21110 [Bryobacteraceae bacterium]|nr:hypothetical protein [Bryobacteraceae bacterium]